MKKLLIFCLLPFNFFAQKDTIFKKDSSIIICDITRVGDNSIFYDFNNVAISIKAKDVSLYNRNGKRIHHPNSNLFGTKIITREGFIVSESVENADGVFSSEIPNESYILAVKPGFATVAFLKDSVIKIKKELFVINLPVVVGLDLKNVSNKILFSGFIDKTDKIKLVEFVSSNQFTFAKLNSEDFKNPIIKKLNEKGFKVANDGEDIFEQKNKKVELALAGEIIYYAKETKGTPGFKTSVVVRWTLFDIQKQENICKIITGGYSNTGKKLTEKEALCQALADAASGVIVSKEIQKGVYGSSESPKSRIKSIDIPQVSASLTNDNYIQNAIQSAVTIQSKSGHGSGFIISTDGYILTNYHVIKDSIELQAIFQNDLVLPLQIIAYDSKTDVALCKVPGRGYKPMAIDTSNILKKVGIDVVTIGTPEDIKFGQTVTKGIISGIREINENVLIQTDVSINSGNSGGMLINKNGEVLGIIVSKIKKEGIEGLGFAIPISTALKALHIKLIK